MKKTHSIFLWLIFSLLAIPSTKALDTDCVKIRLHMHGVYLIRVIATPRENICSEQHARMGWINMAKGNLIEDFYVKKGTRIQILAETGVGEKSIFDQPLNVPYSIDCGKTTSNASCDHFPL
ncbi:MAG: hypothetical protein H0X26_08010 [Alphaproteobacteria bacterium]|nr:hypothetical protein [Alphaproteobacteria bacterium]